MKEKGYYLAWFISSIAFIASLILWLNMTSWRKKLEYAFVMPCTALQTTQNNITWHRTKMETYAWKFLLHGHLILKRRGTLDGSYKYNFCNFLHGCFWLNIAIISRLSWLVHARKPAWLTHENRIKGIESMRASIYFSINCALRAVVVDVSIHFASSKLCLCPCVGLLYS